MIGPAAKVFGEEPFDCLIHVDLVLRIQETVAFVTLDHVLDLDACVFPPPGT
ncbi:MAG TPA: hypothetical protein VJ777_22605 [Mycobacterium sp.]|nr:hypothetical protein [Mycobacterium sp.]